MFRESSHKRKRGNGARGGSHGNRNWNNNQHQQQKHRHWDEPGDSATLKQNEAAAPPPAKKSKRYQIDHSLTQNELWDDSALTATQATGRRRQRGRGGGSGRRRGRRKCGRNRTRDNSRLGTNRLQHICAFARPNSGSGTDIRHWSTTFHKPPRPCKTH
ncbi:hypothetical protein RSAG8_12603, partial [Rhizoctonia solani AG-8 WAC10335]